MSKLRGLAVAVSMLGAFSFAASCSGDNPTSVLVPSASVASPVPTSTIGTAATPTGIAVVDDVVHATLAGDSASLIALLGYEHRGCVVPQQEGSPPGCRTGETPGTIVDTLLVGRCGGNYLRNDEAERAISGAVTTATRSLYAVFRPGAGQADYEVVFVYAGTDRLGFRFDVTGGHIVSFFTTCGPVETTTKGVSDFVVPPQGSPSGP